MEFLGFPIKNLTKCLISSNHQKNLNVNCHNFFKLPNSPQITVTDHHSPQTPRSQAFYMVPGCHLHLWLALDLNHRWIPTRFHCLTATWRFDHPISPFAPPHQVWTPADGGPLNTHLCLSSLLPGALGLTFWWNRLNYTLLPMLKQHIPFITRYYLFVLLSVSTPWWQGLV